MIFDGFYLPGNIIPDNIKSAYKLKWPAIVLFANEDISQINISFSDGVLYVKDSQFSYLLMKSLTNNDICPAHLLIHNISEQQWRAQTSAFKSTYKSFIDKELVSSELEGLPLKNNADKIDFFIDEIVFSRNEGILPIGLALMDTALHSTIQLCRTKIIIDNLAVRT